MSNIICFWSKYDHETELEDWLNKEIELNDFHKFTLLSQLKYNKNVYLYTYQKLKNVPEGINVEYAGKIFNEELAFEALKLGHHIAHIGDIVRLRVAILLNGVVMDMDMVALRPLPDINAFCSTGPAKTEGAMAIQWKENHPPFKIHDNSWDGKALSMFPCKVGLSMEKQIWELIETIKYQLKEPPIKNTKGWNYIMWTIKEIANTNPDVKVFKPIYNGVVPVWKGKNNCYTLDSPSKFNGSTKLFGYTMPSIQEILETSYIVGHYFESAFKGAGKYENIWDNVKKGSLLNAELEHVLGYQWREVLNGN